jgi:hypothetical protein
MKIIGGYPLAGVATKGTVKRFKDIKVEQIAVLHKKYLRTGFLSSLGISFLKKVLVTVPGDPIYQPLIGQNLIERFIFKLSKVMNLGSILVIYAQK